VIFDYLIAFACGALFGYFLTRWLRVARRGSGA
jgi:hypothetical protein